MKRGASISGWVAAAVAGLWLPAAASAVPVLQLYLEGATYDQASESWVVSPSGSSAGEPFRLWAIGNTAGGGSQGTIYDVRLSAAYAYDPSVGHLNFDINSSQIDPAAYPGWTDGSTPMDPKLLGSHVGGAPELGLTRYAGLSPENVDGYEDLYSTGSGSLPSHGTFGPGVAWQEFYLGDMSLNDSPLADFIDAFPTAPVPNKAQINVYEIAVTAQNGGSAHGVTIDFDLYDHVYAGKKIRVKFAPFSHDGTGEVNVIPSPTAAGVAVAGLIGVGWAGSRRRGRAGV